MKIIVICESVSQGRSVIEDTGTQKEQIEYIKSCGIDVEYITKSHMARGQRPLLFLVADERLYQELLEEDWFMRRVPAIVV